MKSSEMGLFQTHAAPRDFVRVRVVRFMSRGWAVTVIAQLAPRPAAGLRDP